MRTTGQITDVKSRSRALKHSIQKPVNLDRVAERLLRRDTERLRLRRRERNIGRRWLTRINR